MKQFGEGSLRKLAMDAPTESIFHFEGEDYKEKRKVRTISVYRPSPISAVVACASVCSNVNVTLFFRLVVFLTGLSLLKENEKPTMLWMLTSGKC